MQKESKKYQPSDLRLTMEQIGRELRKMYRYPKRLPRRLRALATQVRGRTITRRNLQQH